MNYLDDARNGSQSQFHPNIEHGGIVIFDCDEKIGNSAEYGESHQIHISRGLQPKELAIIEWLAGRFNYENESPNDRAQAPGFIWLDFGPINPALRAYLFSLRC